MNLTIRSKRQHIDPSLQPPSQPITEKLYSDLFVEVFKYLGPPEVARDRLTCKKFNSSINSNRKLKNLLIRCSILQEAKECIKERINNIPFYYYRPALMLNIIRVLRRYDLEGALEEASRLVGKSRTAAFSSLVEQALSNGNITSAKKIAMEMDVGSYHTLSLYRIALTEAERGDLNSAKETLKGIKDLNYFYIEKLCKVFRSFVLKEAPHKLSEAVERAKMIPEITWRSETLYNLIPFAKTPEVIQEIMKEIHDPFWYSKALNLTHLKIENSPVPFDRPQHIWRAQVVPEILREGLLYEYTLEEGRKIAKGIEDTDSRDLAYYNIVQASLNPNEANKTAKNIVDPDFYMETVCTIIACERETDLESARKRAKGITDRYWHSHAFKYIVLKEAESDTQAAIRTMDKEIHNQEIHSSVFSQIIAKIAIDDIETACRMVFDAKGDSQWRSDTFRRIALEIYRGDLKKAYEVVSWIEEDDVKYETLLDLIGFEATIDLDSALTRARNIAPCDWRSKALVKVAEEMAL